MSNFDRFLKEEKTIGKFAMRYFSYLQQVLHSIDEAEIDKLAEAFEEARESEKNIFVIGNGGSAATAITMANDIGFDIIKKSGTSKPFKVMSLVDNSSVLTAISNDVGYENVFIKQLLIHYREGDCLVAISASGNSSNILKAVEWVKRNNGKVIGFVGFDGGKLSNLCDVKIHAHAQKGEYGPVEDAHLIINHVMAHWFQNKLKV